MATSELVSLYAMYVIGEVESHWSWTSINYNDPITLGMMQWYGTRAAGQLQRVKDDTNPADWNSLVANAPTLTADVNAHPANDSDFWTDRYVTRAEGAALKTIMATDANHAIQQTLWNADAARYINTLTTWGLSLDRPRELIFAMCMYHQSPRRAGEVVRAAGGASDLDRLFTYCMNNAVLRTYKTRYTTARDRLKAWDAASNPPDFGQVDTATPEGGDSAQTEATPSQLGYIMQQGNDLILYGTDQFKRGVVFHAAGGQRWVNRNKPDTTPITGGTSGDGADQTPAALAARIQSYIGQFDYSQGPGRLSPLSSGYTDCSGLVWFVYKSVAGIDVGTWTGAQIGKGRSIYSGAPSGLNEADLQLGDLVLYFWDDSDLSTVDHVEMYIGSGRVCGHGGPGDGPTIKDSIGRGAYRINVRRYL